METSALVSYDVGRCDKVLAERKRYVDAVNRVVDDVWAALVEGKGGSAWLEPTRKHELSLLSPAPPSYIAPPPSYDDAIADLPPDYAGLPPLAMRKTEVSDAPVAHGTRSTDRASSLLKDRELDVYIDFENPVGIREHKKKKAAGNNAAKKVTAPPPTDNGGSSDAPDQPAGDGGGDAGGGDGAGDGNGDGGGDDSWDGWTTSGSKKKKTEEEEEEERKAAEAAADNKLSWADDMDDKGGADDSWAEFATVGKKKKGKVSFERKTRIVWILSDHNCSPMLHLAVSKM